MIRPSPRPTLAEAFGREHLDPVCGMVVPPGQAIQFTFGDRILFFCDAQCLERFRRSPECFIGGPCRETTLSPYDFDEPQGARPRHSALLGEATR